MELATFASLLNGRQYLKEITKEEAELAKSLGYVIVFGASDDLMEFMGAIDDEIGCNEGGDAYITPQGLLPEHDDDCDCNFCGYEAARELAHKITAQWGEDGYSWTYKTDLPHATFDIMDGKDFYCEGMVVEMPIEIPKEVVL